jgi:hypothetical protein
MVEGNERLDCMNIAAIRWEKGRREIALFDCKITEVA